MKNAVILHGTAGSSRGNWFPWLKVGLEAAGYQVWVPDLPGSETPNRERYNAFLLSENWDYNEGTIIVGHSSGAVSILNLFEALPEGKKVKAAILVGAFENDLGRDDLKGLFTKSFDFEKIRSRAGKFIFIHSDDDPYCPLPGAEHLAEKLHADMKIISGQKHFSVGTAGEGYKQFPFILDLISKL